MIAAVVFDVDGTLTPAPSEVWEARQDAANATRKWADKGYLIIYLSARPDLVGGLTNYWLRASGFADGKQYFASMIDAFQPQKYKTKMLDQIQSTVKIAAAYGDMPSDFKAYRDAKVERVFALRHVGAKSCLLGRYDACLSGWTEHLPWIDAVDPIVPRYP